MRSLEELKQEVSSLNLEMRKLLLNNYNLDDGIADKLTVISTISILRDKLVAVQKEMRLRFPDQFDS